MPAIDMEISPQYQYSRSSLLLIDRKHHRKKNNVFSKHECIPIKRSNGRSKYTSWLNSTLHVNKYGLCIVWLMFFLVTASKAEISSRDLNELIKERADAALKWAPLIWFHPKEKYFPSAVHTFLKHASPRDIPSHQRNSDPPVLVPMSRSLDLRPLPEGEEGIDTYLVVPLDTQCKNCPLPSFLYGEKPSYDYSPPVYATITSCLPKKKAGKQNLSRKRPNRGRKFFRNGNTRHPRMRYLSRSPRQATSTYPTNTLYNSPSGHHIHEDPYTVFQTNYNTTYTDEFVTENVLNLTETYENISPLKELETSYATSLLTEYQPNKPTGKAIHTGSTLDTNLNTYPMSYEETKITTPELEFTEGFSTFYMEENEEKYTEPPMIYRETRTPDIVSNSYREQTYHEGSLKEEKYTDHVFTVTYWMFYPYSEGKEVCTSRLWLLGRVFKPRLKNKCFGEAVMLNSHIGDWEHISIYFKNGKPERMYVSTHTYGAFYHYNKRDNIFHYRGKDTRMGLQLDPKYPLFVKLEGTHPVIYASLGSHGLWGSPGNHRYENFIPLEDKTAKGTPWKSWKNMDIIDYRDAHFNRPDRQWLNYNGKWGNPSKGCHRALFGTCDLASGPTGIPLKRQNFPCSIPDHETFFPKY